MVEKSKRFKTFLLVVILGIALILLYFFIFLKANNSLLNVAVRNVSESNAHSASTIEAIVRSDLSILNSTSEQISKSNDDESKIKNTIDSLAKEKNYNFNSISYMTINGDYWTSNGETGFLNKNNSKLLTSGKSGTIISDFVFAGQINSIISYSPVYINGNLNGVILGIYSKDKIFHDYSITLYSGNECFLIVDKNGKMIYASSHDIKVNGINSLYDLTENNSYNTDYLKKMNADFKNNKTGNSVCYINNDPFIVSYAPISGVNNWYAVSMVSKSAAMQNINYIIFVTLIMGAFVIFCLGIIGYRYSKSNIDNSIKLSELAYNDPLTGYINFNKFKIDAEKLMRENKDTQYGIYYADVVDFKYVNEAFGYDVGDEVLRGISDIIHEYLDEDEIFARVSGDKFVVLKKYDFNINNLTETFYGIVEKVSNISPLSASRMRLEMHVGIFITDENSKGLSINAMLDRAVIALESIKHSDSNFAIYDEALRTDHLKRNNIEQRMETALHNGEFHVYIQPKYKTSDRTLAAGEALIRWHDPYSGIVPPIQFIPIFEKNRFIFQLDRYVLEVVCRFLRMRINEGQDIVPISCNVSPVEIMIPNFTQAYIDIKNKYEIPNGIIELEFTEGVFFENQELFKKVIIELKENGFLCSLDDFGSGYSSLNVLKEMPVDVLKLDRLFFRESGDIERDRSLIRSVVAMARSLKIKTVAEGVETLETVEFLKIIGCNMIQGFVYARPMPLTEFEALLDSEDISDFEDEDEYDKLAEIIPVDKPYDVPLRRNYDVIYEFNITANIYHKYKQESCTLKMDGIADHGKCDDTFSYIVNNLVHPDDIEHLRGIFNEAYLVDYFTKKRELKVEFRRLNSQNEYTWVKFLIIKAQEANFEKLVLFGYVSNIEEEKQKEAMLNAAESRLTAAFIGIAGLVYELDLFSGNVSLIKSYSQNMKNAFNTNVNEYVQIADYLAKVHIHPDDLERYKEEVSLNNIRDSFLNCPSKSLEFEYRAKYPVDGNEYRWYSVRYLCNSEITDKVLITIKDISTRKRAELQKILRYKLIELGLKHAYDNLLEVNLTKNTYKLTKILDHINYREESYDGNYYEFYKTILDNNFLPSDRETVTGLIKPDELLKFYNDPNLNDFSIELKMMTQSETFQWYSLYFVSNAIMPESTDAVVFIFIKNVQGKRNDIDLINNNERRLNILNNMFELVYEINTENGNVKILGGTNVPASLSVDKTIRYTELIKTLSNEFIHSDDLLYFDKSVNLKSITKIVSSGNAILPLFVRSKIDGIKWISINHIMDSRNGLITVFIQNTSKNKPTN